MEKEKIINTVKQEVGDMLGLDPSQIDIDKSFDRYGVDSAVGIGIIGNLSSTFDLDLDPAEMYEKPTISALSNHIHDLKSGKSS